MTLQANWFQTNVSPLVNARDERRRFRALTPVGGVVQPGDLAVTPVGAGTTLAVNVAACVQGGGVVVPGQDTHQGSYFVYNDSAVQLPIAAADPANPRIDTVVVHIYDDEFVPGEGYSVALEVIRGIPAGAPVAPNLPRDCLALADVRVNVAQTGVVAGNITDRRRSTLLQQPRGIIVSGPNVVGEQPNVNLTLNTVIAGPASWLAANTITLPVGADGLYLIQLSIIYRSDAVVGVSANLRNAAGADLMVISISHSASTWNPQYHASQIKPCVAGEQFRVQSTGNAPAAPGYMGVSRLSLVRIGDSLAAV
jgi:hypothetical protein